MNIFQFFVCKCLETKCCALCFRFEGKKSFSKATNFPHQQFERISMLYNPELSILGPIFFSSKFSTVLMKKRYSKPFLTHSFFPPRFMLLCHLLIYLLLTFGKSCRLFDLWKCYRIPTKRSIFKLLFIIGHNGSSTMQATLAVGCVAKRRYYYKMTIIFGG